MSGQILTIELTDEANDVLKRFLALDNMYVTECKGLDEAAVLFARELSSDNL